MDALIAIFWFLTGVLYFIAGLGYLHICSEELPAFTEYTTKDSLSIYLFWPAHLVARGIVLITKK